MAHQIYRLDFSQLDSPRVRRFHDYWKARRNADNAVPLRTAFDPTELRKLLPNIVVVEVEQGRRDSAIAWWARAWSSSTSSISRGLYLGAIGWDEEQQIVDACADVVMSRQPLCGFDTWTLKNGAIGKCEFGNFPFSHDGETVTQIFVIDDYDFPHDYRGARSRAPL